MSPLHFTFHREKLIIIIIISFCLPTIGTIGVFYAKKKNNINKGNYMHIPCMMELWLLL